MNQLSPALKPQIVVFSSSAAYPIAEALSVHLRENLVVHPWRGEFFGENKTTPLWTFFKKLFHYDYAILILTNENLVLGKVKDGSPVYFPNDNVLFELGACMARLGPQKTILVVPEAPEVRLPGYFDDVEPNLISYTPPASDSAEDSLSATQETAAEIKRFMEDLGIQHFHSELPAQGLAHAYLLNFFNPVIDKIVAQEFNINGLTLPWTPECGLTFSALIPQQIMGRRDADQFFKSQQGCYPTQVRTGDGRDLGIYALPRTEANSPLHILDIPTTLLTAQKIIDNIETFWRETDREKVTDVDQEFISNLTGREILNFIRTLQNELLKNRDNVYLVEAESLPEHIKFLTQR